MAPLAGLQRFSATLSEGIVFVSSSLRCLTALQHLCLAGFSCQFPSSVVWQPGSALPVSLTSLCLGGEEQSDVLPHQVRMHAVLIARTDRFGRAAAVSLHRLAPTRCPPARRLPACMLPCLPLLMLLPPAWLIALACPRLEH